MDENDNINGFVVCENPLCPNFSKQLNQFAVDSSAEADFVANNWMSISDTDDYCPAHPQKQTS